MNTLLFSKVKDFSKLKDNPISSIKLKENVENLKIKSLLFNLEIDNHFKISEDLNNFFSKLLLQKDLMTSINEKEYKINKMHALLFEIYSEILNDIFIFTLFMNVIKIIMDEKPILLDNIEIDSTKVNFKSLSRISFIFQKIKKYILQRDNNIHANLEKIVIMIIEEIELNFLSSFENENIKKENAKEEYEKFLHTKNIILNSSMERLNKFYFEPFELINSNKNANIFEKINYLAQLLIEFEEPYFYGLFENKTKANFLCFLKQVEFFINLINNNYDEKTMDLFSNLFLNINNLKLREINNGQNLTKQSEINDLAEDYDLLNSDYLILNYMRINIFNEGKYIL